MNAENEERRNPYAEEDEDTAETSLAGRFFLLRWYKRTTRGFGASRPFFMPFGFLGLCMLAFHLGFPALEELVEGLLVLGHKGVLAVAGLFGSEQAAGGVLSLQARRAAVPVFALGWASVASVLLTMGAFPPRRDKDELGYVVPGSGVLARTWAIIGRRLYQLKAATRFLLAYLRDLNLQKIHLPVTVVVLVALGFGGLSLALENLLYELPARIPGMRESTGWIPTAARLAALVATLVLGLPMVANSVLRAHARSVRLRTRKKVGFVRRRLTGLFGLLFVFFPLAWILLRQLGESLPT